MPGTVGPAKQIYRERSRDSQRPGTGSFPFGQRGPDPVVVRSHDSPAAQIVDSSGNVWTLGAAAGDGDYLILENGVQAGGGEGGVLYYNGDIYTENVVVVPGTDGPARGGSSRTLPRS